MSKAVCPLCGRRKPRRACPAQAASICSVCCGTKRLIEIACPPDCTWLQSASAHPPAVVQRQRERDVHFLIALLHGMTAPQQALSYRLLALLAQDRPDLPGLTDADIAEAAQALAQTAETASRLPEDLQFTGGGVTVTEERDLWDMPVLFLLLAGLLGAEWGYRRKRGLA